jgi:hypothetical protein
MLTIMMPDVPLHPHCISLQEFNEKMMMDKGTCWAYISDSLASFCWCVEHKPGWLTANAQITNLLQILCHSWTQDQLSKSCYGNKQSALFRMAQASQLILSRNLAVFCMVFIGLFQ